MSFSNAISCDQEKGHNIQELLLALENHRLGTEMKTKRNTNTPTKKTHINEETLNKNQYFAIIEQDPSSFTLAK